MAVWLIRAGSHGEYEHKFLEDSRVYVTWDDLDVNIQKLANREALTDALRSVNPDAKPKTITNWVSQIWPFAHEIKTGGLGSVAPEVTTSHPNRGSDGRLSVRAGRAEPLLSLAVGEMDR